MLTHADSDEALVEESVASLSGDPEGGVVGQGPGGSLPLGI